MLDFEFSAIIHLINDNDTDRNREKLHMADTTIDYATMDTYLAAICLILVDSELSIKSLSNRKLL